MTSTFVLLLATALQARPPVQHVVTGVVVEAKSHAAVHGATISLPNGKRLGVTSRTGRFRVAIADDAWPASLTIAAPGFGAHSAALPHVPSDADLKEVGLSRAARVHVTVPPMLSGRRLQWKLGAMVAGRHLLPGLQGGFPPGHTDLVIDGLEAGNYGLIIAGEGPLQHAMTRISLRQGETLDERVDVMPFVLKLTVRSGDRPFPSATVQFSDKDLQLTGTVHCDERGMATEEMWQSGEYLVSLMDAGEIAFGRLARLQTDDAVLSWTFELPPHRVKGHVVDSATHLPLRDVALTLRGTMPEGGGAEGIDVKTDEDGRFEFRAVKEGRHSLQAYLKGYRYDRPLTFTLAKDDVDYETEILLERFVDAHSLVLTGESGRPIGGANVALATAEGLVLLENSDSEGRVTLPPQREGVVFAIPPGGSFAFARIPADLSEDVVLHVPPATGAMEIISRSTSGEPIANIAFMVRVDGTMIPPEIFGRFISRNGLPLRTDATGRLYLRLLPPGFYELWPVRTADELRDIRSGKVPQPAAAVPVAEVPQLVTLTFKKRLTPP